MIVTTTDGIDGRRIVSYLGIVSGQAIMGANVFRDAFARIRDIVGGRSAAYERAIKRAKDAALEDMATDAEALGADAIVGVDLDYEVVGQSMLMVSANGTAVRLR